VQRIVSVLSWPPRLHIYSRTSFIQTSLNKHISDKVTLLNVTKQMGVIYISLNNWGSLVVIVVRLLFCF